MFGALKNAARRLLPESLLTRVVAVRSRRLSHKLHKEWRVNALSERLFETFGTRVLSGPFAGLELPRDIASEHVGPYLMGVYEHELHPTLAALATQRFERVINVGAKFGYYAVGLAKLLKAPVIAFDVDPWARRMTAETARLNGLAELVTIESECRRDYLAGLPANSLVVIDCDSCEMRLLAPPLPDGLRRATIVVEVHEMYASGSGHTLKTWLEDTHRVSEIPSDNTTPSSPVDLSQLSEHDRALTMKEIRPDQSWLICTPRN